MIIIKNISLEKLLILSTDQDNHCIDIILVELNKCIKMAAKHTL